MSVNFALLSRLVVNIYIKCMCEEKGKLGVPCPCFWRISWDAQIPQDKLMDVGMFDVRWMKLLHTIYGCDDKKVANLLY